MFTLSSSSVVAASIVAWVVYKLSQIGQRESSLPPGPPTIPLLGNLHIFPKRHAHYQFSTWAKQYGDIYSLKVGPKTVVVLSSPSAIRQVMEKKSALTSDRPRNHMVDLITGGKNMALAPYLDADDSYWKRLRRGAHEVLSPQACIRHLPIQQAEAAQLMHDLLIRPQEFYNSVRRFSTSLILSVVFGKRAPRFSSQEVTSFFHVQHMWENALTPGAHPPVDLIPVLKLVPERFARWKTLCKDVRRLQQALYFGLVDDVRERVARGEGNGCYMETVLERAEEWRFDREMVGYFGGSLLSAGSDTTSSFLQSLILALVAFPDVQKKAQEEIDSVVGPDRAPTLEDVVHLPYVQAIIKEVHRFRPAAPLALPHRATADVMYKGHQIPAEATIFINMWGVFHDEKNYEDEDSFNPDRYLNNKLGNREDTNLDLKDWKEDLEFGIGRRVCPGVHLAKNSTSINTVNLLWGFNFGKAIDHVTGAKIEPDVWDYSKGLGSCPNPFNCTITPRSPRHADIIERQFSEMANVFAPFERELSDEDRRFVAEERTQL